MDTKNYINHACYVPKKDFKDVITHLFSLGFRWNSGTSLENCLTNKLFLTNQLIYIDKNGRLLRIIVDNENDGNRRLEKLNYIEDRELFYGKNSIKSYLISDVLVIGTGIGSYILSRR